MRQSLFLSGFEYFIEYRQKVHNIMCAVVCESV